MFSTATPEEPVVNGGGNIRARKLVVYRAQDMRAARHLLPAPLLWLPASPLSHGYRTYDLLRIRALVCDISTMRFRKTAYQCGKLSRHRSQTGPFRCCTRLLLAQSGPIRARGRWLHGRFPNHAGDRGGLSARFASTLSGFSASVSGFS